MGQNIGVTVQNPDGSVNSMLNMIAATLIKGTPGRLGKVSLLVAGTTGGAVTFNDANALVTAQTVTGITAAANAVVTISTGGSANPFAVGDTIGFASVGGMTQINSVAGIVTAIGGVTTAWTITTNINSSAFSAYTSGGTAASYGAGNEIWTLPEAAATNLAGALFDLQWPCLNGILMSAVFTATPQISVSFE